jgi:flagellar motor switch protein FliN/FliY
MALKVSQYIETAFSQAAGSMTGKTLTVSIREEAAAPSMEEPIVWQQAFSVLDQPSCWIAAGKDLWEAMGRLTLEAAGLTEVTDADCRSTWHEIVNQTMAGVASGITGQLGREVTTAKGQEIETEPLEAAWTIFSISDEEGKTWTFKAAWAPELTAVGEPQAEEVLAPAVRDHSISKTFDVLLDVALPVSVSFGKTSLQIREVLKLNTGSIVELDRFVTDPVEVIVNNCVIARGEVVVVEGNYGVRINHLASRDERLHSGIAEAMRRTGMQTS